MKEISDCRLASMGRALFLILAVATIGYAQNFTGFRGRITDPTGAAVVGASIKVTEEKLGFTSETRSNEVGEYELRGVLPGTYTLEVEMPNFKTYKNTGVIVYARSVRRVDIPLELGAVAQTVAVQEQGARIETDVSRISYKAPLREVYSFNISGGGVNYLSRNPGSEGWSQAHGSFANQTNAEQDGITNDAYGLFRTPQETVKEVNYVALNAPAEYRTSTNISLSGRTGSNDYHAEYFINFAHDRLNALPAGVKTRPRVQRPSVYHELILSGPVYIPRIYNGKNKTFVTFMYQPLTTRSSVASLSYIAPTMKMRNGDFSEWAPVTGRSLIDPLSGQPFPDNQIPRARFGSVWNKLLAIGDGPGGVPTPNVTGNLFTRNYLYTNNSNGDESWFYYRVDHKISEKNTISVTHLRDNRVLTSNARNIPQDGGTYTKSDTRAVSVQDSHIFSPRVLNEFTFSYNRQAECAPCTYGGLNGAQELSSLGINVGARTPPNIKGQPHFNMQTVGAGVQLDLLGAEIAGYMEFPEKVWQIRDNLSYQHGKHLFKTGLELRQHRPESYVVGGAAGVGGDAWGGFSFTGAFTGNDFGDFVLGLPEFSSISNTRPRILARGWEFGYFIQDEWKITPNLTLSPGLRLEHYGAPYEAHGLFYNYDIPSGRVVVPNEAALKAVAPGFPIPVVTAAQAGYPAHLEKFKSVMWEPRVGIAWRPFPRTVLRAGYGIYHDPFSAPITYAAGYRGDSAARGADSRGARAGLLSGMEYGPFMLGESFGPNKIVNGAPLFTTDNPFPTAAGGVGLQTLYSRPVNSRANNWPYDQQWNLTFERELPLAFSGRISYVGSKGTDWPYVRDLNNLPPSTIPFTASRRPYPNLLDLFLIDLGGNSIYHGLEMELSRQFSRGLYFRGWYEWKKDLNDVLGGRLGDAVGAEIEDPYNRAREKGYQQGFTPHAAWFEAVYDLPTGRGQRFGANAPGWLNHLIGNWAIAPLLTFGGHTKYDVLFSGANTANTGRPNTGFRADVISGCDPYAGAVLPGTYWNRSCFATPPNGRFGNSSRGLLDAPWVWNLDFNAFKTWYLIGREKGPYFKTEFYASNFFNHGNTGSPVSNNIASPNFGRFLPSGNRTIYFRFRIGF